MQIVRMSIMPLWQSRAKLEVYLKPNLAKQVAVAAFYSGRLCKEGASRI